MKEGFAPPIPMQVLADAQAHLYSPDELARKFSRAMLPRATNRYGCVTLHSYHFYIEEGVPPHASAPVGVRRATPGSLGPRRLSRVSLSV